jgi:hypothetical protein
MVSAIGPKAHSDQISKSLVFWWCANEQRLTIDVTPSPRLEDLRQGLRMPGHASYLSHGHLPGQAVSTSLVGTPQGRPAFPSSSCKVQVSVCPKHQGNLRYHPRWIPTRCIHQGEPGGITLDGFTLEVSHDSVVIGCGEGGITLDDHDLIASLQN